MNQAFDDGRKIFSLSKLTESLQTVISKAYSSRYWITAEIAKLNLYPKSGHCYPDLVEKNDKETLAQMRAIIWANDFIRISQKFKNVTNEELNDGIKILFQASVTYSPKHGLSLQIWDIEPTYTMGQMAKQKLETIKKLKNENLYFRNKELALPQLLKKLAIISVDTSKGYQDFKAIIDNNEKGFKIIYHLYPSLLQGDQAVDNIIKKLEEIELNKDFYDAVLIIRGGGGDIGLSCYDNYKLAKKVATFPLPIISGIGHSTNETVVEMVSHLNKITPTDVAYTILNGFETAKQKIDKSRDKLLKTIKISLDSEKYYLENLPTKLIVSSKNHIKMQKQKLFINLEKTELLFRQNIKFQKQNLENLSEKVQLLDPKNVLKRGYSISTINGKTISDSKSLKDGDIVETQLLKGKFISIVKK